MMMMMKNDVTNSFESFPFCFVPFNRFSFLIAFGSCSLGALKFPFFSREFMCAQKIVFVFDPNMLLAGVCADKDLCTYSKLMFIG